MGTVSVVVAVPPGSLPHAATSASNAARRQHTQTVSHVGLVTPYDIVCLGVKVVVTLDCNTS